MRFRYNLYMSHRHRVPKQPFLDVCKVKIVVLFHSCTVVNENVWRLLGRKKAYVTRASFNRSDNTWASSVGGPGLNFGEQIAGRSIFGTMHEQIGEYLVVVYLHCRLPRNPSPGRSNSGSAISAFTPQTMVVSPRRTSADPSAVDIDPTSAMSIGSLSRECLVSYQHSQKHLAKHQSRGRQV
jgi:hypothetical protein